MGAASQTASKPVQFDPDAPGAAQDVKLVEEAPKPHPVVARLLELEGADPIKLALVKLDDTVQAKTPGGPYDGYAFKAHRSATLSQMTDNGGWEILLYPKAGFLTIQHTEKRAVPPVVVPASQIVYATVAV